MATVETLPASPIAMMIDIETLSLRPDAFVTQVGVCVANTVTREYLLTPTNSWLTPEGQEGRDKNFDTICWWMQQDPKVAAGVFKSPEPRTSPEALFYLLKKWADGYPAITIWGSPAMFDLPVLTSLWGGRKPWKYNYERDMMTLYKLVDPTGALQPPDNDKAHDAAADAQWQMEYLFNLLGFMRDNSCRAVQPGAA